jgi:hypothetical protein
MAVSVNVTGITQGGAIDVTTTAKEGTGQYLVTFTRSALGCMWSATLAAPANETSPVHIPHPGEVSARLDVLGGLRVLTMNSAGVLADRPFHLIVVCPGG